jgi:hypothetical protein
MKEAKAADVNELHVNNYIFFLFLTMRKSILRHEALKYVS